jgi:hypothetical protein
MLNDTLKSNKKTSKKELGNKLDKIEKLALKIYPKLEYSDLQDPK